MLLKQHGVFMVADGIGGSAGGAGLVLPWSMRSLSCLRLYRHQMLCAQPLARAA